MGICTGCKYEDAWDGDTEECHICIEGSEHDHGKSKWCPECGCGKTYCDGYLGEGYRVCARCDQEWWTTIDYNDTERSK